MLEKTLNARKKIILLRSIFAFVMVFFLALGFLPARVLADIPYSPIDYTKLDYVVRYGSEFNQVTVPVPSDFSYFSCFDETIQTNEGYVRGRDFCQFEFLPNREYSVYVYPFSNYGISLKNVPVGAKLVFDLQVDISNPSGANYYIPNFRQRSFYANSKADWIGGVRLTDLTGNFGENLTLTYTIEDVAGAAAFIPSVAIKSFETASSSATTFTFHLRNVRFVMDIPSSAWEQFQAEQNGEMLGEIKGELGNVNDKLDDTNEKLEELPGEIGDEMQGVIDKENDKAESSGNKFVNQILDKLPDPSTEVLGSLKGLTDSMAYTGTDCKLQIPALVIPAIDGLFPETEIWGGTEFSFSDYLSFLPSTLLTVVQSLFTIAIVLFCVYELKGIISYCLTLNDKKGG